MITLEIMQPDNWKAVKEIYEGGIATGNATFQQSAPQWEEWNNGDYHVEGLLQKKMIIF